MKYLRDLVLINQYNVAGLWDSLGEHAGDRPVLYRAAAVFA